MSAASSDEMMSKKETTQHHVSAPEKEAPKKKEGLVDDEKTTRTLTEGGGGDALSEQNPSEPDEHAAAKYDNAEKEKKANGGDETEPGRTGVGAEKGGFESKGDVVAPSLVVTPGTELKKRPAAATANVLRNEDGLAVTPDELSREQLETIRAQWRRHEEISRNALAAASSWQQPDESIEEPNDPDQQLNEGNPGDPDGQPAVKLEDKDWEAMLDRTLKWQAENPAPAEFPSDIKSWVTQQKTFARHGKISKNKADLLSQVDTSNRSKADVCIAALKRYKEEGGNLDDVSTSYKVDGVPVGKWYYNVRVVRGQSLTPSQREEMEKLGAPLEPPGKKYDTEDVWMDRMRAFYRAKCHCTVRKRVNTEETALYHWLGRVRKGRTELSPESRAELEKMGCNLEDDKDGRSGKIDRIAMMEAFKSEHGHCKVKQVDCGYGTPYGGLYNWLNRVRRGDTKLSDQDRTALEELGCDLTQKKKRGDGGGSNKRKRAAGSG